MIQATEVIKLILGIGESLEGRLLHIDALKSKYREIKLKKDPNCQLCGDKPIVTEPIDYDEFCGPSTCEENNNTMNTYDEITPLEAKEKLMDQSEETVLLLDVREPEEREGSYVKDSLFIPLGEIPDRYEEIPKDVQLMIYCKAGVRSAMAAEYLISQGYENVINVEGGILEWEKTVGLD